MSVTYTSPDARFAWHNRLRAARTAWSFLELESVACGLRDVCLCYVAQTELRGFLEDQAHRGLTGEPLLRSAADAEFSHADRAPKEREAWRYRVIVARRSRDVMTLKKAWNAGDDRTVGLILGYPHCCADWFSEEWAKGNRDPIRELAEHSVGERIRVVRESEKVLTISSPWWELSPFLRYIGIRVIPHIPHSLACTSSLAMAERWLSCAAQWPGLAMRDLTAALSLDVRYDRGLETEVRTDFWTAGVPTADAHKSCTLVVSWDRGARCLTTQ